MVTIFQKPAKKESKKDLPSKASTSKKKSKDDEDGKKKKQKKKDPNAPKRAMSGFMFFCKLEREVCSILCHIGYMVLDLGVEVVVGVFIDYHLTFVQLPSLRVWGNNYNDNLSRFVIV